jgi:acyl dehydratase
MAPLAMSERVGRCRAGAHPTGSRPIHRPIGDRSYEDYQVGTTYEYGSVPVTQEEIIGSASQYAPQSLHVDPVAAEQGPFGGLVPSPWHTVALTMHLFARHYLSTVTGLDGPDEVRRLTPVRRATLGLSTRGDA